MSRHHMDETTAKDESNRMIIVVTGANSGLGLGYCHRILRQLSLPPTTPTPDAFILHPPSSHSRPSASNSSNLETPPTLTLILACRNERKAREAIKSLWAEHELGLIGRKLKGLPERKGWKQGLRIIFEPLDVDSPSGPSGILPFCSRLRKDYPYISTLVLNAGIMPITGISYPAAFRQLLTDPVGTVTDPKFLMMEIGRMSADGQRGGVWGVNTLANYVLAKELRPLLARSPKSSPLSSRIILVTSKQADPKQVPSMFPVVPLTVQKKSASSATASSRTVSPKDGTGSDLDLDRVDWQLVRTEQSYDASKYMAELMFARLDNSSEFRHSENEDREWTREGIKSEAGIREGGQERRVRCLVLDPGVVHTSFATGVLPWWMVWLMVGVFWFARLAGSQEHNISAENGAAGLSWLTVVDDAGLDEAVSGGAGDKDQGAGGVDDASLEEDERWTLLQRENVQRIGNRSAVPTRYCSLTSILNHSYTAKAYTKQWHAYGGAFAERVVAECEKVWVEWREAERAAGAGGLEAVQGEEKGGMKEGAKGTAMV